jgi:lambda family phage portal protein
MARPRKPDIAAQPALNFRAKYDAAGSGRRMRAWNPPSTGPNKAVVGIEKIRNRARDAARNDWSGESASQKWVTNLIGVGITPRLKRIANKARRQELTDLWARWVEVADADSVLNFYGLQALAVRAWLDSGEVFVRRRMRRLDSGLEVPMQVQMIEAEFVPMLDADSQPGMPAGHKIRSGIELDRRGQRAAYWMHREHPGDGNGMLIDPSRLLRVPASEVSHIYEPKRPGQLRGVSAMAPVLARLRSISDFDDAVLERMKLANLFTAFITQGIDADGNIDPMSGLPVEEDGGQQIAALEPGLLQTLGHGEDIKFSNPPEAGVTFSDYMRTQHLGTAAASGIPYEIFSGDIREVSDRTLRVVINEFRRFAEQRQWHIVIPMLCQRTRVWWTEAAVLAGLVSESEALDAQMVEWAPHGWSYIHPVQDPQGKKVEVEAGFRSRASVIGERGDDPEQVDEERASDMQREKDLGLWVDPLGAVGGTPDDRPDEDGIDSDEYAAPPNAGAPA